MGGFASVYGTLHREYNMSDEEIGEIRIGRLVQMMSEIKANQEGLLALRHAELEWQTRAITHFIANTVEDQKGREQLTKAAASLEIMPKSGNESAALPTRADTNTRGMTPEEELEYIMTHGDENALAKNEKNAGKSIF